jgi:hypothetical protein
MKVSLRLILIRDDEGKGQNVRPLAQRQIALFDLGRPEMAGALIQALAKLIKDVIRPDVERGILETHRRDRAARTEALKRKQ